MLRRLHWLDGLRGIAAFVVVLHHLLMMSGKPGLGPLPGIAVDVFFVLSGYVMARTYERRFSEGLSAPEFVGLRYRRLFLPLAIGTTLGLIWRVHGGGLTLNLSSAYPLALAFLPAFWLGNAFLLNVPAWSLFLEIVANAIHGSVLWRMSNRALGASLAGSVSAAAVLFASGWGIWDYDLPSILSLLPREMSFYLVGILVWRLRGDVSLPLPPAVAQVAGWLGAVSYPLYATHVPVIHLAETLPPLVALVIAFALASVIALQLGKPAHDTRMVRHSGSAHSRESA